MKENKKLISMIIVVTLFVLVVAVGSYAWLVWQSKENTKIIFKIGEIADVTFKKGNDISTTNITPVLDYNDGETTTFEINNKTMQDLRITIMLNIDSIDKELQDESLKYKILKSLDNRNYKEVMTDNFSNIAIGSNIILEEEVTTGITYYKFILCLEGSLENNILMMDKSMIGTITVSVLENQA